MLGWRVEQEERHEVWVAKLLGYEATPKFNIGRAPPLKPFLVLVYFGGGGFRCAKQQLHNFTTTPHSKSL